MKSNRREFLTLAALGAVGLAGGCAMRRTPSEKTEVSGSLLFGSCVEGELAAAVPGLEEAGYSFYETSTDNAFMPGKSESDWTKQRHLIESFGIPLRSCNGFYTKRFRLTGPEPRWDEALGYADVCFRRGDEVGLKYIVLGSGGARNQPAGFPLDKAVDQFVEFCKRLADRAASSNVTVVLEPLPKKAVTFLRYVSEGVEIAKRVNHPRLKVLADLRHMANNEESADSILKAGTEYIKHTHIAVKTHQLPGFDDPGEIPVMLQNLVKIGYAGGVSLEGVCGATQIGKFPEGSDALKYGRMMALAVMRSWAAGKVI